MKYEKCLTCKQLGEKCDGPNLLAMETVELGLWCNELRKAIPGLTGEKIAAEIGLGKTTVSEFLKGKHEDCSMLTARKIVKYLTKGKWDDNPCGNLTNAERSEYEERIRQLEADIAWRDDKIKHLTEEIKQNKEQYDKNTAYLKASVKSLKRALITVSIFLGLSLTLIIAALIIDRLNSNIGFFWLESLAKPHGITEVLQQWRT